MRLRPSASAALISPTGVAGLAMKNLLTGTDVPAVAPFAQDGPAELRCSDGTKTLKPPAESA